MNGRYGEFVCEPVHRSLFLVSVNSQMSLLNGGGGGREGRVASPGLCYPSP